MSYPDVTVVVAAHDGDIHYLPRALTSLEMQENQNFEVIVAFDGPPSPKTEKFLNTCETFDLDIRVIASPEKTGYYCVPRNYALPFCRGHYIVNLDVDNEFEPEHIAILLEEIRRPGKDDQTPDLVYGRRRYVRDPGVDPRVDLPEGESPLCPPTGDAIMGLHKGPSHNFIDTSDFIVPKSVLYELAERTGVVWNPEVRRFGDWELMARLFGIGVRARASDHVGLIYHWTGSNLQTTRSISEVDCLPSSLYNKLRREGKVRV